MDSRRMSQNFQEDKVFKMSKSIKKDQLLRLLSETEALNGASQSTIENLIDSVEETQLSQGQTLLREGVMETHAFLLLEGSIRLLGKNPITNELFTVGRINPGELIGIVNLMRQGPCETAIAREPCKLLSIPLKVIYELTKLDSNLQSSLSKLQSPCEGVVVLRRTLTLLNPPPKDSDEWIIGQLKSSIVNNKIPSQRLLSSVLPENESLIGTCIDEEIEMRLNAKSSLPLRFWNWRPCEEQEIENNQTFSQVSQRQSGVTNKSESKDNNLSQSTNSWKPTKTLDMSEVGLREARSNQDLQGFKIIKGKGAVAGNLATLRMLARAYETPCPVDVLEKILEGAVERAGSIPIHAIGQLAESMGLQTQVGLINIRQLHQLELPVIIKTGNHYSLLTEVSKGKILLADPEHGWETKSLDETRASWGDQVKVVLIKRLADTPQKTFGWNWFSPVLKRFKWPLGQVLIASLFIQLFQLANPLLIQQIIDKVINQSNLSALQVLGGALVVSALFQGLLTAVRTWLLIDTTDRMDLILGSQVIDKLLRLPLRFFENRPVGELSQRLSELGNLRGFLTGTAITSLLDLLFATIYIGIMLVYSPLLTAVALSTIPLYIIMVLIIAPLYRKLIRRQAQFAARTQSHLIETLGGIQTVKAQHMELNSRWRWQERYSGQIAEGFKSVVLGSTAGEIGNFLNQLSSLLIIWVGVYLVVNGEISLGQMIAFRIISGYVTGPILRLSSLWQGFQQVGISMERLADIIDQIPEGGEKESGQIALPPILGEVKFDSLRFRFGKNGPYQIDGVNLSIDAGNFVGIVGQSGSGKSTLMKLLPRLYTPEEGRILIDGYDINKVSLTSVRQQIGIVPQDCLLFEGSIRENICMNHPEADTETVIRVARAAVAHEFIMDLPDGYNTLLGERGSGISGGQKQRIAIARTLLQNPNLLILDEATSALDYDTEATLCLNLQKSLKGKTVFFITHRLSTVRKADKIILMHHGKIAEQGTHEELIDLGGRYATLSEHQGDT